VTGPPPDDLKSWSKNDLVRELRRLRAVMREHAERVQETDVREASVSAPVIGGGPRERGGSLIDARGAVLLDGMEVVLVDTEPGSPPAMLMSLSGRINYAADRVQHAYLFGADGAAGLVTELLMLSSRAADMEPHGAQFHREFEQLTAERLAEGP
jgi:hypothetical protein